MKDFAILSCLLGVLFVSLTSVCHIAAVEAEDTPKNQTLVPAGSMPGDEGGGVESNDQVR